MRGYLRIMAPVSSSPFLPARKMIRIIERPKSHVEAYRSIHGNDNPRMQDLVCHLDTFDLGSSLPGLPMAL